MRIQICWITTKTLWIHYLVDVNHFFKFGKSHKVTNNRVTTCLENLEMSGILTAVREMSGILQKVREMSGKNLVGQKLPKSVYC